MGIIAYILLCALVGLLVWAITKYVPMPPQIAQLIVIAAVVILVLVLISALAPGLFRLDQPIPPVIR